nr:fumarate hydratase [Gemmatimonadaceae bacterium]
MTTTIRQDDFVQSVADALQHISYYHPLDYIHALGSVVVFVKVGMDVRWDATLSLQQMVDEGVRRAYLLPDNILRASIVADPAFTRKNTRDNTPAVVHVELV